MSTKIFNLKMLNCEKIIKANEDNHILDSMNIAGTNKAPNGCHGGGCGVCKIKILKGDVKTICMSSKYISYEEKKDGYVLACRAFPLSDLEFEFIGKAKCKVNVRKKYGFV